MLNNSLNKRYLQLMWLCFFAYMISYIGRLGYNTNIQNYIDTFGVTKMQVGYASSAFFFCYGAGQFVNGILCEKMNSVKTVSISLLISSFISLSLFFITNMIVISILWGLNGFILSALWCNCVKIVAQIKDNKYKKKSVVILALALPIGTFFAYGVSSLLTLIKVWQIYFVVSFAIVLFGSFAFLICTNKVLRDIDRLYVPTIQPEHTVKNESIQDNRQSLFKFLSLAIIPVFFISVCISIIKDGVQTWMPTFLKENYTMPTYFSILITLVLPLVGVFASMFAKWVMDKTKDLFLSVLYVSIIAILFFIIFILLNGFTVVVPIITFAVLSLLMHTSNTVFTAIFPVYYSNIVKSGRAAGIFNGFAYVGSALSSFMLGGVVDSFGWDVFVYVLLGCTLITVVGSVFGYFYIKEKEKGTDE